MLLRFAVAVACLLAAAPSYAQEDADARARACEQRGRAAFEHHDWDGAMREFEAGYRNKPSPVFLHGIAEAAEQAGQRQKAVDHYRLYLQMSPDAPDRDDVQQRIDKLDKEIAAGPLAPAPNAVVAQPEARKKRGLIIGLSVAGAVLVIGAVAVGVTLGTASNSPYNAWGSLTVKPH